MALFNSYDSNLRKPLPKPLLLKDYLLDDLNSCSSSGFRSYPRRQCCCTTVRLFHEIDLKTRDSNRRKKLSKSKSKNASTTMSAFQRASLAVINAVKLLPFSAVKSPSPSSKQSKTKNSILPSSLSRKLLKRGFWKRTDEEIERLKSFKYLLEEKEKPSDFSSSAATANTTATDSNSSTSESNGNSNSGSNSWSDCDFTSDCLRCSSGNSESSCDNDVVERKGSLPEKTVSTRVAVTIADASIEAITNPANSKDKWPNEEKEQFSPVSVLDFPFDDEEEVSSPFQRRLARMEGTKQNLMQKIQQFESLAQLEPVDLEKQFSLTEFTDESLDSPLKSCSDSIPENFILEIEEEEDETQDKAVDLLELMKATIPLNNFKFQAGNLLLDFFTESTTESHSSNSHTKTVTSGDKFDRELLNAAKDWMNGQTQEMFLEWEVQKNRQAYVRDMEKGGKWSKLDEHKEEVAMELEVEVFASLMNELLLDLFSS